METICYQNQHYITYSAAVLVFMPGMNEIRRLHDMLMEHEVFGNGEAFQIHPLHSTISSENQSAVFDLPPMGVRKIVIGERSRTALVLVSLVLNIVRTLEATNIAETGITIPDITCVIDSGKHREMRCAGRNYHNRVHSLNRDTPDLMRSVRSAGLWKRTLPRAMLHSVVDVLAGFNLASAFTSSPNSVMTIWYAFDAVLL